MKIKPFLFLIHINEVIPNVNFKSHLYVDDAVLLIADKCAYEIETKVNTELKKHIDSLLKTGSHLNPKSFLSKHCRTLLLSGMSMLYFDYCSEGLSSASLTPLSKLKNL